MLQINSHSSILFQPKISFGSLSQGQKSYLDREIDVARFKLKSLNNSQKPDTETQKLKLQERINTLKEIMEKLIHTS
jgi:hypothetical protein